MASLPHPYTARERAALPGGSLDRWIGPFKWLLPWAAVACVVGLIVQIVSARPEFSFVLKREQAVTSPEHLRIERALYRGVDKEGRPFSLRADQAVQRSAAVPIVDVRGIDAEMRLASGPARVVAASGAYDIEHDKVTFIGPVHAVQGNYALTTGRATLDIKAQRLISDGPVTGRSALGAFRAAHMEADVAGQSVVLNGGASLHIDRRAAK